MTGLETQRLIFRNWQNEDFQRFYAYFSDKNNTRFLGGVKDRESAWRTMAAYVGHLELKGYGYVALEDKSTGNWVGTVGLWNSDGWPEPELGYWILEESQGKGFAFEAAEKAKNFAREELKLKTLVSYIHKDNQPSIRLAEKLGSFYDGEIELLSYGPHGVYRYW